MNRIRLGAAAVNQTPMAWDANARHIRAALAAARDAGVGILCLPELCITGYGCEDMFFSAGVQATALEMLARIGARYEGSRRLLRTAGVLRRGGVQCGGVGLRWPPVGPGRPSSTWRATASTTSHAGFAAGRPGVVGSIEIGGAELPIGDLLFDVRRRADRLRNLPRRLGGRPHRRPARAARGRRAAQSQRESLRIRQAADSRAVRAGRLAGVLRQLRLRQSAGQRSGPRDLRRRHAHRHGRQDAGPRAAILVRRLAAHHRGDRRELHAPRKGRELSRCHSANRDGRRDGNGRRGFRVRRYQRADGSSANSVGCLQRQSTKCAKCLGTRRGKLAPHQKEEEFARAVSLALFDYLRKSRAQGFVVSLSGGADSSTVAVLVHLLVQFGGRELGFDKLAAKLSHIASLSGAIRPPTCTASSSRARKTGSAAAHVRLSSHT